MHNDQLKPVTEVSQETFSSDGTSDIITCNLPIGTKLYAIPDGCTVVQRELLEQAAYWLDVYAPPGGSTEQYIADELRALLGKDGV